MEITVSTNKRRSLSSKSKRQFNFFMIAHFEEDSERKYFYKALEKIKVGDHQTIYCAQFGPIISSPQYLYIIQKGKITALDVPQGLTKQHGSSGIERYRGYLPAISWCVKKSLKLSGNNIDGFIYYGHSIGIIFGGYQNRRQLITVIDLVDFVLKPIQPIVCLFDACYVGILTGLYELTRVPSIKYTVVSPSYHTTYGIFDTSAFSKIGHGKSFLAQLRNVTCEYQAQSWPKYKCFIVVQMKYLPRLVKLIANETREDFEFTTKTRISKKDIWTHDLYRSTTNPKIKNMITRMVKDTCGLEDCKIIKGVSIDAYILPIHQIIFKNTRWYKETAHVFRYETEKYR